jgi:transposase
LQKQIDELFESIRLARHQRFGASSEKAPGQGELFDEAEDTAEEAEPVESEALESSSDSKTKKQQKTRKPLPAQLPRIRNVIELPEDERVCPCGCQLSEIGEDVSEQLEIIPAKLQVIQHVRKKYACKSCEETIKIAPTADTLLPKAIASANTMAYIITAKYADGLPLYRLSTILKCYGIELSRQTMSESVITTAQKLEPFMEHFRLDICASSVMHMDETTVQVRKIRINI